MKKRILNYFFLLCVMFANKIFAQTNLVPNPSFEDTTNCNHTGFYLEDFTSNWRGGYGYYNTCQSSIHFVPTNYLGYQNPKSGGAYIGITTRANGTTPAREYIQTKLVHQLVVGKKYKVSFYISLADTFRSYTNSIGAYFSPDSFFVSTTWLIEHIPQIQNNFQNNLSNKIDWSLVCDTFVAVGNEKYITIGNFYNDNLCPLTPLDSICAQQPGNPACGAYYYIDDVSVELVDESGLSPNTSKRETFEVLPNPNKGSFNLSCSSNEIITCQLLNIAGQIIDSRQYKPINNIVEFDYGSISKGLYILKIYTKNGTECLKLVLE